MAITSDRRDSPSLLLVEDDAPLSRTLSKLLQKQGLDVVCCPTAKEAVEQLDRDEFAVAILDLHLPD
ncbi:MAG: response regulator, partial [Pirellulaceae bacterium]|nr:response regulator [Pirellulaceae bacterium]